jgi:hypothetical protein
MTAPYFHFDSPHAVFLHASGEWSGHGVGLIAIFSGSFLSSRTDDPTSDISTASEFLGPCVFLPCSITQSLSSPSIVSVSLDTPKLAPADPHFTGI